jgi:hypothetical protein
MAGTTDDTTRDWTRLSRAELVQLLGELFQQADETFEAYQWPVESLRWNELAFCILAQHSSAPTAGSAARALLELNLLDLPALAELPVISDSANLPDRTRLLFGIVREAGFSDADATRALNTLTTAARAVQASHQGKIQRVLREAGERMVTAIVEALGWSVKDDAARRIVTRWLHSVLNLPVFVPTTSTEAFCNRFGVETHDLIAAADELDVNVAIVDDLVETWHQQDLEAARLAAELTQPDTTAADASAASRMEG